MDTLSRIKDLAARELGIEVDKLDPKATFDTLGVDSLSFVEFMFKVEDEFGIKVSDEELNGVKCFADLERLISAAGAAAGKS